MLKPSLNELHDELRTKAVKLENELVLDKTSGKHGDLISFHGSFIVPTKEEDTNALVRAMLSFTGGLYPLVAAPFKLEGVPPQEYIQAGEVKAGYRAAFKSVDYMFLGDDRYKPSEIEWIQMVLDEDKTDQMQYVFPWCDCDDFAFALMGAFHKDKKTVAMPIFITWVDWVSNGQLFRHAINSFYVDGRVILIEPQTDEKYTVPENWDLYLLVG